MADWTFKQVLTAIRSPPSIPDSVLEGPASPCLEDICFVELHTMLKICSISLMHLEWLIANRSFNPKHKVADNHSHTTAILLTFVPDANLMDIEKVGIRLVVHWHSGSLATLGSVQTFIDSICKDLKEVHKSNMPMFYMYVMLIRNYGGHMAFTTDPPFCLVYPGKYYNMKDPCIMMICNPENHPATNAGDWHGAVLTPGAKQSGPQLHENTSWRAPSHPKGHTFWLQTIPRDHHPMESCMPYIDPTTRMEALFLSVGPFHASDPLFTGIARDCKLYMVQEVVSLKSAGALNPPVAPGFSISSTTSSSAPMAQTKSAHMTWGTPKMKLLAPKVEPDSASNRWAESYSLESCQSHPSATVEVVHHWRDLLTEIGMQSAGHNKDRDHDRDCNWDRDCDHNRDHSHQREQDQHCDCTSDHDQDEERGCDHSRGSKHGWSGECSDSIKHRHCLKEHHVHSPSPLYEQGAGTPTHPSASLSQCLSNSIPPWWPSPTTSPLTFMAFTSHLLI